MNYLITEKEFLSPDTIRCNYFRVDRDKHKTDFLIVSFVGNYPDGSLGKNQTKFRTRKTTSRLIEFDPEALVLNFRDLTYNWYNNILDVIAFISDFKYYKNSENEPNFPPFTLISKKIKNGIRSLFNLTGNSDLINFIFEDKDITVKNAIKKEKYWLDF